MQHTLYVIPHSQYLRDSEAGPAWPLLRDLVAADAPGAQHPLRGAMDADGWGWADGAWPLWMV